MMLTIQLGIFFFLGIAFSQKLKIAGLGFILAVICVFHTVMALGSPTSTVGTCLGQVIMIQLGFAAGAWARAVIATILVRVARAS